MSAVYSLRGLGLALADAEGVIPATTVAALDDAALIVARARAEAEAITAAAHEAREDERRRGHAEGLREAQAEAAVGMHAARQDLEQRLDGMQTELADLVAFCVKRIVHSFDDRTLALETVRSALAALRSEKRVQLYVSPSAEAEVRAGLPEFLAEYPEIQLIDVIVDAALVAPDVRLESELGVLTASLGDTLAELGFLLRGRMGGA